MKVRVVRSDVPKTKYKVKKKAREGYIDWTPEQKTKFIHGKRPRPSEGKYD